MTRRLALLASVLVVSGCASSGSPGGRSIVKQAAGAERSSACDEAFRETVRWARRLALGGWSITFHCAPPPSYGEQAEAEIHFSLEDRTARVYINPATEHPEEAAVHELLHILVTICREARSELVDEQVIRVISRNLVGMIDDDGWRRETPAREED